MASLQTAQFNIWSCKIIKMNSLSNMQWGNGKKSRLKDKLLCYYLIEATRHWSHKWQPICKKFVEIRIFQTLIGTKLIKS